MEDGIKVFFDAINIAANTTTLFLNLKSLKVRFPVYSVISALQDTSDIERIIDILFYRKQVMWEHSSHENHNWCINSLKELRGKCDQESDFFLNNSMTNDKNHFFATLLRTLGNYADETYKDIVKSDMTYETLDIILKKFRKNSYPIIVTFLFSLPETNTSRVNGLVKLELGIKNSKLTVKQILPTWAIEP